MSDNKEVVAYNLVVDEDRDKILNSIIGLLKADSNVRMAYFSYITDEKLGDAFMDFFEEISDKSHSHFGCSDKNCKRKE